jgi:hypothetical protein
MFNSVCGKLNVLRKMYHSTYQSINFKVYQSQNAVSAHRRMNCCDEDDYDACSRDD